MLLRGRLDKQGVVEWIRDDARQHVARWGRLHPRPGKSRSGRCLPRLEAPVLTYRLPRLRLTLQGRRVLRHAIPALAPP